MLLVWAKGKRKRKGDLLGRSKVDKEYRVWLDTFCSIAGYWLRGDGPIHGLTLKFLVLMHFLRLQCARPPKRQKPLRYESKHRRLV